MPGMAPMTTPMRLPRKMEVKQRLKSAQVRRLCPMSAWMAGGGVGEVALMISGMANRPMSKGMKLKPAIRFTSLKVIRPVPKTMSMPTLASSRPKQAEMSPLSRDAPDSPATMVREKQIREKNSAGPKRRAKLAIMPVQKIRARLDTMSAKQEAYRAMYRACPALPCRARG